MVFIVAFVLVYTSYSGLLSNYEVSFRKKSYLSDGL